MGNCEKGMDNKELMEKLEKMDKKLNALCEALMIFISTRGRRETNALKERLEKEGKEFEGVGQEVRDQLAMVNVCHGLNEAMEEGEEKKKKDVDDLMDRIIKEFFS